MLENIMIGIRLWIQRVRHGMFCNVPFELENYCEYTNKGIIGSVRCQKCGAEFFILNKK
ncbi:TPA: hypothetical protein MMJ96_000995 [Clostridium botulinum]|nr:hypothetical protein [Clostridium botulinum]HBZ7130358.1 hypothetical protein [Clostridium botulinum]HBZ7133985.1 hypothetical protein [Clostridium botulinum]